MSTPQSHFALLTVLLALAASSDVARRKIPNWLTVGIALTGLASHLIVGGTSAAASGLLTGALVLALAFPFWMKRLIGGGDVKLAAGAGIWIGLSRCPRYLLASAVAGGMIALACYALSTSEARTSIRANMWRLHAPALPRAAGGTVLVPYGAAFALGAIFALYTASMP